MSRQPALDALPRGPVPAHCELEFPYRDPQERTLYIHATDPRALIEPTKDGNDYRRICARHQWASDVVTLFVDLGDCPECVAEIESPAGRRRYTDLHAVNVRIIGTVCREPFEAGRI